MRRWTVFMRSRALSRNVGLFERDAGLFSWDMSLCSWDIGLFSQDVGLFSWEIGLAIWRRPFSTRARICWNKNQSEWPSKQPKKKKQDRLPSQSVFRTRKCRFSCRRRFGFIPSFTTCQTPMRSISTTFRSRMLFNLATLARVLRFIHVFQYMHIYTYGYIYVYVWICVCVWIYVCICICMRAYMCICI